MTIETQPQVAPYASRADEMEEVSRPGHVAALTSQLLDAVKGLIIPFIRSADPKPASHDARTESQPVLLDCKSPNELKPLLNLDLPQHGSGRDGLLAMVEKTLKYSVNTWDQGFMDKLYASTNPVSDPVL
jgi:glutamate decarboxylase